MRIRTWLNIILKSALAALLALSLTPSSAQDELLAKETLPPAPFVMRVYYDDIADVRDLARFDLFETNNLDEKFVLVSGDTAVRDSLIAQGWAVRVDPVETAKLRQPQQRAGEDGYRGVDEVYAELESIAAAYPDIVEIVDYGDSYCKGLGGCMTLGGDQHSGYDLRAVRITNQNVPGTKPVFFLVANIHAREITTPEIAMRLIDRLTQSYADDADIAWMVDHQEVWIVPIVNPDGRWLVDLGTMPPYNGSRWFQRKNANDIAGCNTWPPSSFSQYGVDLNRNHSFEWNTGGTSRFACDQTYLGVAPASEPEVDALEALVASVIPDQRGDGPGDAAPLSTRGLFITLHSYGEWVLRPWGNVTSSAPNESGLKAIGDKFATYNNYTSCQSAVCLYEVSGASDDFAYGELGVPAYTFELGDEFMPPYGDIDAKQWPDNEPALLYAARIARAPYLLAHGPDVNDLRTVDLGASRLAVIGQADDSNNGGDTLQFAFYSVDKAFWEPGFTPRPMGPLDGAYDTATEDVGGVIDLSTLTSGRHIVYVNSFDTSGNLGPASAIFVEVP